MKTFFKIIGMGLWMVIALAFLFVGPLFYIPQVAELIAKAIVAIHAESFISTIGIGLFTSIASILAGILITLWIVVLVKLCKKNKTPKVKKEKVKKFKVKKTKKVRNAKTFEEESLRRAIPTPVNRIEQPDKKIKF